MNIIHIGLGKTGSTSLQELFFPKISEKIGYKYWLSNGEILDKVKVHYAKLILKDNKIERIETDSKILISHEGLSGFHAPELTSYFAEQNLKAYLSKIPDETLYAYNVYQIEGEGRNLFLNINGDEDTIMGLPVFKIKEYLKNY